MDLTGNTFIEGQAGKIEALLKVPSGDIRRAVVVSHPHPMFGGTMHNKVVYRIAKTFQDAGFATLRYNFRGAGRSEGRHDNGRGEQDDLRAAMQFIESKYPDAELWLAGFSFGAAMTTHVGCADSRPRALALAGLPVSKYDFSQLESCDKPKLLLQGDMDEFGSVEDLKNFYHRLHGEKTLRVIANADHFFEGKLTEMGAALAEFIQSLLQNRIDTNKLCNQRLNE